LREKQWLRVFENSVLRKIFGPKRDEIVGEGRRLHKEELYNLYSLNNILVIKLKRMRWTGHVTRVGRGEIQYLQDFGGET
jgi:hypothetical protein